MPDILEYYDDYSFCPLDCVEDVLNDHNWVFDRNEPNEIMVEVAGKSGNYRLIFLWQKDVSALQLCCQYDLYVPPKNYTEAARAIMTMNTSLWLGHFELNEKFGAPLFRQTSLIRDESAKSSYEHIEDLVEICLTQCERFFSVFDLLTTKQPLNSEIMSLAMMETKGES